MCYKLIVLTYAHVIFDPLQLTLRRLIARRLVMYIIRMINFLENYSRLVKTVLRTLFLFINTQFDGLTKIIPQRCSVRYVNNMILIIAIRIAFEKNQSDPFATTSPFGFRGIAKKCLVNFQKTHVKFLITLYSLQNKLSRESKKCLERFKMDERANNLR